MSSALRVGVRSAPPAGVVELHGDVSADGEQAILDGFAEAVALGSGTVLFDLSDAQYINTSGISVLITVAMGAKKNGQTILVSGTSAHYRKVFDLVRFSTFVAMFDTESEALASLSG